MPGLEVKPLLTELRNRMVEELDYRGEADTQRTFHAAYHGDPEIAVPAVVASAPKVLVSEWVTGTPLSRIIRGGSREERDGIGYLLSEFHFSAPERARLLHADPHPGNFLRLADGRLCVLDFGAAAKLPDGAPRILGIAARLAVEDRPDELLELLRSAGFVRASMVLRAEGRAGLPRAAHRAAALEDLPLHPRLDAVPGGAGRGLRQASTSAPAAP